jgi:YVTN family beta-propeller protein
MRYVRTDAATPYNLWMNSSWIVYNPPTSRFFVTEPGSNRVFVLDASTEAVVATINVPGAFGIDDTPDHRTLYAGTQIGDVYEIDPVSMTVTNRYPAGQIGPNGFGAYSVRVMADGRLALLGGQGGIPSVDGYGEVAIWSPTDNSISTYTPASCDTSSSSNMGSTGVFTRTPDRTKVVLASIDSDGTLCEIDEAIGAATSVASGVEFIWQVAISPDGKWIVLPSFGQAFVYDAGTLAQVAKFDVAGDTSSAGEFFVGPDSQTLYVSSDSDVYAYNLSSGQQVGWFPNIVVPFFSSSGPAGVRGPIYGPQFQAMDGTGLLVGPIQEGVGFLDTTAIRAGTVGTQFLNGYLSPATGPTAGGTSTGWTDYDGEVAVEPNSDRAHALPVSKSSLRKLLASDSTIDVYFGGQNAGSASVSPGTVNASETISVTTPPGAPGRADVYALASDGGVQLLPEGFSYGPTVLEITPNAAAAGGGPGAIMGYGFGPTSATTVPSNLQVTVGGTPATVTLFTGNAYEITTPPFPLEGFTYTIPAGAAGSSADVMVSTSSGSVTVHSGIAYLPAVQQYPLSGSALAQGVYDSQQDVYYFTDATKIQVFSRTAGAWMNPIGIPAADAPQRLWGIALSPNGSKLAVADGAGDAIYFLNPESPVAVQKFPVPQPLTGAGRNPVGVAISDAGIVYFTASTPGGTGYGVFFKLDTNSGQVTDYGIGSNSPATDNYLRTILSADNSTVYGNDDGGVFSVDTGTDSVTYAKVDPGCCYGDYDLSLSSNQTAFAATGYFYDSDLNAESYVGLNLREMMNISYLYGEKLSPDGTMLFQPTTDGIDVLDARLGILLERIALPVTLSPNYDALVSDGTDNVLVAITGANGDGIAVIDLTSVPEPSPLPYETGSRSKARLTGSKAAPSAKPPEAQAPASQHKPARHTVPHVTVQKLLRRP